MVIVKLAFSKLGKPHIPYLYGEIRLFGFKQSFAASHKKLIKVHGE
jgi:hypothetical protein